MVGQAIVLVPFLIPAFIAYALGVGWIWVSIVGLIGVVLGTHEIWLRVNVGDPPDGVCRSTNVCFRVHLVRIQTTLMAQ